MITIERATKLAKELLGDYNFRPTSGKKVGRTIIIKGDVGGMGYVKATFEIPENTVV